MQVRIILCALVRSAAWPKNVLVRTELEAMLAINEAPEDFYFGILYYYRLRQESGVREKVLGHSHNYSSGIIVKVGEQARIPHASASLSTSSPQLEFSAASGQALR